MEEEKDKLEVKNKALSKNVELITPKVRMRNCYDIAKDITFESHRSITQYYRGACELIKQAKAYDAYGDLEKAYILYVRSLTILVDKLNTHPQYNTSQSYTEEIKKTFETVYPVIEKLKEKLLEKYEREYADQIKEQEEQERRAALKQEEQQRLKEEEEERQLQLNSLRYPPSHKLEVAAAALTNADESRLHRQVLPPKSYLPSYRDEQAQSSRERKVPSVDRSTKPTSLMFGDKLRDMIIPKKLMQYFLKLAFSNTSSNIETCAILAGRLEKNRLVVTHFLIPKQTGSPDSCVTHNEEGIFDFQDQNDLITLGWIHTHPSQTAFLSSVDLHTHCAYQLMMAEAIAIVCAPKYDETGFFHLTPEYGLNYIANCKETSFHPHPSDPPLFTTAKHFTLDPLASIEAIDLRRK